MHLLSKKFTSISKQDTHSRTHTGEKPFPSNQCTKAFSNGDNLKVHLRTYSDEKLFPCNQCSKAFSDGQNLKTHLCANPFPCNQCPKAFLIAGSLKTHSGEKPFPCNQKSFQPLIQWNVIKRWFHSVRLDYSDWIKLWSTVRHLKKNNSFTSSICCSEDFEFTYCNSWGKTLHSYI